MGLDRKIREYRIEEIRVFLSKWFNKEHSTDEALDLIVANFYDRYLEEIKACNKIETR